ncbi:MAG: hypothetical protein IJZ85_08830 [Lachnospiraceae bacterium]|nr:hypothetical protein [Lachnospiraceae bacterium]
MFGFRGINLFMFLMFYIVLPIIYFTSRNEWKPKKNIMLGVTLPSELIHSDEVEGIGREYRKELDRWTWILTLLGLPAIIIKSVSISMTWDMFWLVAVIVYPQVIYIRGWKRLKELKKEHGYEPPKGEPQEVKVDLTAIAEVQREPSPWWYVPPMIMGLIPCILGLELWGTKSFWWMESVYLSMFVCVVLFFAITYKGFRHQKVDMVNEQTDLTIALTRVRHYNWHKMMLSSAWLTGAFSLAMYFLMDRVGWLLAVTAIYTVVILVLAIQTEFTVRRVQENLSRKYITDEYKDEDEYWLWGSIYYNPRDKHILKNARTGMNMTVNLATTGGKVYMFIGIIVILAMPFMGFWLMAEEFTPINVHLKNETLIASHLKEEYVIELEDIQSVEHIDELPPTRKDIGTNMDTLLKGQFRVDGYGVCQMLLNPEDDAFVVVTTEEDTYIFSVDEGVSEALKQKIK